MIKCAAEYLKEVKRHQNVTGSCKKDVEALNEFQDL